MECCPSTLTAEWQGKSSVGSKPFIPLPYTVSHTFSLPCSLFHINTVSSRPDNMEQHFPSLYLYLDFSNSSEQESVLYNGPGRVAVERAPD